MVEQLDSSSVAFMSCALCCNWDVSLSENRATRNDRPQPNYPKKKFEGSIPPDGRDCPTNLIFPKKPTNQLLLSGAKFAYENRMAGKWNKTKCREYLATMAIAEKVSENIKSKLETRKSMSEEKLEKICVHPYIWETKCDRNDFINAPMHKLGHGVMSKIILKFHKFLTSRNKGVEFEKCVNNFIFDLMKFWLEWCKLKPYPKKLWVSKNTFRFS